MFLRNLVIFGPIILSINAQRIFQLLNQSALRRFVSGGPALSQASVLPSPNGPFYGITFDPSLTMRMPFPFPVSGSCKAGKVYTISKRADLLNYKSELECVYSAGMVPQKVPEGSYYGRVLSVINTPLFNFLVGTLWKGKMTYKIPCNGNETFIGYNYILGTPLAPFIASVGPLNLNFAPGEHQDGKDAFIIDYTQDFRKVCPDYGTFLKNNYEQVKIRRRNLNGVYPFNQIVDALRLVGKQEDGGSIYLGKSYMKDFYRNDLQAATVAYWYIVNYDETANPRLHVMESLPPLKTSFKYMLPGPVDFVLRLLPFDNLLTTPVRTARKLARAAVTTGKNALLYTREIRTGLRSSMANRRRFQYSYNSQKSNMGVIQNRIN